MLMRSHAARLSPSAASATLAMRGQTSAGTLGARGGGDASGAAATCMEDGAAVDIPAVEGAQRAILSQDRTLALCSLRFTCLWRAGVPVNAVLREHLAPEQLRAALLGKPVASMTLHDSHLVHDATYGELLSALADAAPQLTALHRLPVKELQDIPPPGLAGSSRLRTLTLRQTPALPEIGRPLYADVLPAGLTELRLEASNPLSIEWPPAEPPHLVGFSALHSLRHKTLAGYEAASLDTGEPVDGQQGDQQLPHGLQVPSVVCPPSLSRSLASIGAADVMPCRVCDALPFSTSSAFHKCPRFKAYYEALAMSHVVRLEDDHAQLSFFSVQGVIHDEERVDGRYHPAKVSYAVTLEASAAIVTLALTYPLRSPGAPTIPAPAMRPHLSSQHHCKWEFEHWLALGA